MQNEKLNYGECENPGGQAPDPNNMKRQAASMADGMIGADPEQLLALAKTMENSGSALKQAAMTLSGAVAHARWTGPDSERFRVQWNNGMRAKLNNTANLLSTNATLLKSQADEQTTASASGGGGATSAAGGPGSGDRGLLGEVVDANGNPIYQGANMLASVGGVFADNLLGKMIKGELLQKLPWTVFGARAGQLGQYFKGTQLLNGLSMLGRASGALSVIGGGMQFAEGFINDDGNKMLDGGISAVLGVGSFFPVVGPAFAIAGVAWAGLGILSTSLGYDSTSEMIGAGAQWTGAKIAEGASWIGKETANVAKKAWGWVTGG